MAKRPAADGRRLLQMFGDVLPDTTSDERPDLVDAMDDPSRARDQWLRDNRPPHHDGDA